MDPRLQVQRLASTVAMQFVAVYVVGLVTAVVGVWRGSDRSLLDWVAMAVPAALFVPALVFAVQGYRASGAGVVGAAGRRALVLAVLGAGLLAVAIVVWRAS
jgi:hypothetical protein